MALRPIDWSVRIPGRWNRAILTPQGISTHVLGLELGVEISVRVPMDGASPYLVRHPDKKVVAFTDTVGLSIICEEMNYECLAAAMECGVGAMGSLPVTPFLAAGFNIDYVTDEVTPDLAELVANDTDSCIAQGHDIIGRLIKRSLAYEGGTLNITIECTSDQFKLSCNFHKESSDKEALQAWLKTPTERARDVVEELLICLELEVESETEETVNDADG